MVDEGRSEEEVMLAAYALAAEQLAIGKSSRQIHSLLVAKGLDQESAATVASNAARMRSESNHEAGRKDMVIGGLMCVGGIIVTAASYGAAPAGGTYLVAWGAIVFGAFRFIRGRLESSDR